MNGLAATLAQPTQQAQQLPSIEEVVALLLEGVPPEELEQMGVPAELIMQAIEIIEQQMGNGQQPQPVPAGSMGGGLAEHVVGA